MQTDPADDSVARLAERFLEESPEHDLQEFSVWWSRQPELSDEPVLRHRVHEYLVAAQQVDVGVEEALRHGGLFGPAESVGDAARGNVPEVARQVRGGDRIGHYVLLHRLGRGGMGEVWEAEDPKISKHVALKLILPGCFDEWTLALFAREAKAGGRLSHPNLVSTIAFGEEAGLAWIAQELVTPSWTLKDSLDALRAEADVPRGYFRQVALLVARMADGMQAAHDAGVVHRDLKPQNVLIRNDDMPKVADFGLARIADDSFQSRTYPGGTLFYMSPEQVVGRRVEHDHRTDIFSLGVVLYELLTLRRPFDGDSEQQVFHQILSVDPPQATRVRSQCPADLAVIAGKAIEKVPERRYSSMASLAADLRRYLNNEPILARPAGRVERLWKWMRRNPTWAVAGGAAALLVALLATGMLIILSANRDLSEQGEKTRLAKEEALENSRRSRRQSYLASLRAADVSAEQERWEEARDFLELAPEELRGWDWRHLQLQVNPSVTPELVEPGQQVLDFEWAPSGRSLAMIVQFDSQQEVWLVDLERGATRRHVLDGAIHLAWCPDGRRLAIGFWSGRIEIRNEADWELVAFEEFSRAAELILWSPDSDRIVVSVPEAVRLWDVATGKIALLCEGFVERDVLWHPESLRLAIVTSAGPIRIHDASSGELLRAIQAPEVGTTSAGWSLDGSWFAYGIENVLHLIPENGGEALRILLAQWSLDLAWGPAGSTLAVADDTAVLLLGEEQDWKPQAIGDDLKGPHTLRWSPGGEALVVIEEGGRCITLDAKGRVAARLLPVRGLDCAWSADGAQLAVDVGKMLAPIFFDAEASDAWSDLGDPDHSPQHNSLLSAAWDSQGKFLVGATSSGLRVWSAEEGRLVACWKQRGDELPDLVPSSEPGTDLVYAWSPHRPVLACTLEDGSVVVLSGQDASVVTHLPHPGVVQHLAWHPREQHLATLCANGSLRLWSTVEGELLREDQAPVAVHSAAWSPDGDHLLLAAEDGGAQLWDPGGRGFDELSPPGRREIPAKVRWRPSRRDVLLVSGGELELWEPNLKELLWSTPGPLRYPHVLDAAWSPDGETFAVVTSEDIRILDADTFSVLSTLEANIGFSSPVWSPDGNLLAVQERGSLRIWDPQDGAQLLALQGAVQGRGFGWNADGSKLAAVTQAGALRVWHGSVEEARPWWRHQLQRIRVWPLVEQSRDPGRDPQAIVEFLDGLNGISDEERALAKELASIEGPRALTEVLAEVFERLGPGFESPKADPEALALARFLVESRPDSAVARLSLAYALHASGERELARLEGERVRDLLGETEAPGLDRMLEVLGLEQ